MISLPANQPLSTQNATYKFGTAVGCRYACANAGTALHPPISLSNLGEMLPSVADSL